MNQLSLIIPCYNEAKNLPSLIDRCEKALAHKEVTVILVDNGSVDETPTLLARRLKDHAFIETVRVEKNQGYGFGILSGLAAAKTPYLGWTHADMQTDPADCLKALALIKQSSAPEKLFIKGRRSGRPMSDRLFTLGMTVFETLLLRRVLVDINAQPVVFARSFFALWKNAPHDFSLDLYAYYQAKLNKLSIQRIPVIFSERLHGVSHWNTDIRAKIKFIKRTLSYSFNLKKQLRRKS